MTNKNSLQDKDEVLYAFHVAYQKPNAEQIIEWVERYPQFAEDIRAHAAVAWDWASMVEPVEEELDEAFVARCYSEALNLIYNAENETAHRIEAANDQTLQQMRLSSGKEIYQLATALDISRGVLSALFNGSMLPPIRRRLVEGICSLLSISRGHFDSGLTSGLRHPQVGFAKAKQVPVLTPRPCDDIIRDDTSMSLDRKRYWLEED